MFVKTIIRNFRGRGVSTVSPSTLNHIEKNYGKEFRLCHAMNDELIMVLSKSKDFDLIELEQLLQAVGWNRRPLRRVRKALDKSLLKVGLWLYDQNFPRLIGFARCTGDGILEAAIWDVAIHPVYQGGGLGKQMMSYVLESLKNMGLERVTLFADPGVVAFYEEQGWDLEPNQHKCAFWYAN
tara:strand:- start:75 stop:620 length:546 start_codon:yes stop_codon:yes gene_type:complete